MSDKKEKKEKKEKDTVSPRKDEDKKESKTKEVRPHASLIAIDHVVCRLRMKADGDGGGR